MSELTIEQMKKAIDEDRASRAKACGEELRRLLDKYQCKLEPVITITGSGIQPGFQIIALEVAPGGES